MRVSETNTIIEEGSLIHILLPGVAVISLQSASAIFSENSVVNVCAEIQELPAGGLGTDITVDFRVDSFSAGTLENVVFHAYSYGIISVFQLKEKILKFCHRCQWFSTVMEM